MIRVGDKFIADNGEVFFTEKNCTNYEKALLTTSLKGKMFDRDLKPVDNFSKAYYFLLGDQQDLEEIERLNSLYGICAPIEDDKGLYYFDDIAERYINLSNFYKTIVNLIF